ncbi:MAG: AzlD domain-containing protein [Lachnospiraceae bacterium]|nr:AzlD domain-containing protein [Lachnospiraceae bacterium]
MNKYIYLIIMISVIFLVRVLPVTLIRRKIDNRFIQSFLYYVPYVTLAVMTFPAIMEATSVPAAGAVALVLSIIAAWFGLGLFPVSIICCVSVFILEFFMI